MTWALSASVQPEVILLAEGSSITECQSVSSDFGWNRGKSRWWMWCWPNVFLYPVLKHGPRSLTYVRVQGWKTLVRNESNSGWTLMRHNPPAIILRKTGLSVSTHVGTRKMVNYAWIGWSQGKLWWRLVAILTCKSIVKFGYRGERLIEPSSSWFPPKFPLG